MLCFDCHKKSVGMFALSVMTSYVCKKCGKTSVSGSSHTPGAMCYSCSESSKLCEECGRPSVNRNWFGIVDSWGEKDIVVIYHENCQDGKGAAYSAWKKFMNEAAYVPLSYDDKVETSILAGKKVYVLDFSFSKEVYDELEKLGADVFTIDHHKSAKDRLSDNPNAVFDMGKSGCVLSHEYFFPNKKVPKLLKMVEDRDLWKFEMEGTEELYHALRNEGFSFLDWEYYEKNVSSAVKKGIKYKALFDERVSELAKNAEPCIINGKPGLATFVNSDDYVSELGNVLAEKSGTYALIARKKDGKIRCSLRSVKEFDASEIAESFGGGGHKNACAFTTDEKTYEAFLKK